MNGTSSISVVTKLGLNVLLMTITDKYFPMLLLLHVNFAFARVLWVLLQMKHIHENLQLSFWKHFVFCLVVFFKELDLFLTQISKFDIQFFVRNIAKIIFSFIP